MVMLAPERWVREHVALGNAPEPVRRDQSAALTANVRFPTGRTSKRWPWDAPADYFDRSLADLRRDYGIRLI
jgi:hypothetical protein